VLPPDQAISHSLSRAIHEHKLPPGIKLGEAELAEVYGVSRTVVRTALRTLAHDRLVEIKRNRGAFVAQPSPRDAQEVFEARELLEPRTAREAARRATSADIEKLLHHVAHEHEASTEGDRGLALYLSGQLHVEIAKIAGQQTITGFIETLIARSSLVVALYWRRESAICGHHDQESLVRAIKEHRVEDAEALMKSHLVDLHSALDLNRPRAGSGSLKDMLTGL
jgi:DNA-binding GntR family transcriptional regulator